MQTKKLLKVFALTLIGAMTLVGCDSDEMVAQVNKSEHDIKLVEGDFADTYNNYVRLVYDTIHDGSIASDVLDEVLYMYAKSVFGTFDAVEKAKNSNDNGITLDEAINGGQMTQFLATHPAYANEEEVISKYEAIEKRVAIEMYNMISGGAYSKRNKFSETKLLISLRNSLNKVANPKDDIELTEDKLITPDIEDYEVFTKGILHKENYWSSTNTYVQDRLIPNIYRQLLVEQYIIEESYNSLGRSYARKINVVAIANNSEYPTAAKFLAQQFVKDYIVNGSQAATLDDFKVLSNAWKGVDLDDANNAKAKTLLDAAGLEVKTIGGEDVYLGTAYADLMDDYSKIVDDPLLTDTTIESNFTNNNAYTKEVGLEIKSDEIALKDYTTTGWYTKNGGVSALPGSISDRLFNISVANAVNNSEVTENNYIKKYNGKSYLRKASSERGADEADDILFYDSGTFYVVQIEEAVSASKLEEGGAHVYDDEKLADVVNEVVKLVADSESYKTLSTKHWLEKAGIREWGEFIFHDEQVYNYFKSNYNDLFEDWFEDYMDDY